MMKTALIAISIMVCLCFVGRAIANPIWLGEVPPDSNTSPPNITVISPENKSYNNSSICLNFKVNEGESRSALSTKLYTVGYKADWMTDNITLYSLDVNAMIPNIHTFSSELSLTDIPEGTHSITVYAVETGTYNGSGLLQYYTFTIQNFASVTFTVNALDSSTPPVPEFPILGILPLVVATSILATRLLKRK